ncbi:MAG: hypothetical protein F9K40_21685, partial [Kofleriaceae bacterium]
MSRTIIGAIVGVAIAVLTAVCYVVVTGGLADRVKADAKLQMSIARIPAQAQNNARLDLLNTQAQAETMAKDEGVVGALRTTATLDRVREADLAFSRFHSNNAGQTQPDVLALVDAGGNIVAMDGVNNPVASELKDKDGKLVWRGLALTLESGHTRPAIAEIWNYPGRGLMRTGVAAVVDRQTADGVPKIIGAVVIAYSQSSKLAREERRDELLHARVLGVVALAEARRVDLVALEVRNLGAEHRLLLARDDLKQAFSSDSGIVSPVTATIDGQTYLVGAVRMPRYPNTKALPADYPPVTAGALVLAPAGRNVPEHATAGRMVIVLGAIALLLALGAMWLSSRRILDQVDELEVGVAEIINGNLERTFRPVGA